MCIDVPYVPILQMSEAAATLHALLAACCRPLLAVPPSKRNVKQVEALAELLAGFEVRRWPALL
jgi:hypothetical protein